MEIRGTLGDRAGLGPLKSALHAYALRHRVVSGNIANAEVPGYRAKRVEFETYAERILGQTQRVQGVATDPRHMPIREAEDHIEAKVVTESAPSVEAPGVDIEKEIVSMVENQLSYRLAVRLLEMKYRQLHAAITGSSR